MQREPAPLVIAGLPPLWLVRPSDARLRAVIAQQRGAALTYPEVGATRTGSPPDYHVVRAHLRVGRGEAAFRRAVEALRGWRMFQAPWLRLIADGPPHEGQTVAFASWQCGVWTVHACRVVYAVDEVRGPVHRVGFAYGTLPRHGLQGEEAFVVTWDQTDDTVGAGLHQFSRPNDLLTSLAGPVTRRVQRRFVDQALGALARAAR